MSVSWQVSSLRCHNNNVGDTWWCLESPGTADSAPDRHTPVSGSLGNVFMPPVSRVTRHKTDWVSAVDSVCLEAVCSVYLVMTAARLLQLVTTAAPRLHCRETAWAGADETRSTGPRTPGLLRAEKWESELRAARQSSLQSDGCRGKCSNNFLTHAHFKCSSVFMTMMRVHSTLLQDNWYLLTAAWSPEPRRLWQKGTF